jgi:Protein of unknown function (DUF2867)
MKVREIAPQVDAATVLAGAQFIDAFAMDVEGRALDPRSAAKAMMGRSPRWIGALTGLRNFLVAPLGLKTSAQTEKGLRETIGLFPILSETPDRVVAGFNDKHLDFRVVVDVAVQGPGQRVTATTLVKTHNRLGRVYLAIILPFHRLVVPAMMRQIAIRHPI